ncbi:SDR family NAD(P)-dependent oxidoreductase [Paenibacillus sp. HN-1]|uniref:SDR family NAD(P)-dependent oxidoreductase n=1 Tax=Paenibacillus TaxID=44249 RepID=UPI001CAA1FA2|nr:MULTISPECIES: SDR family NAD(P)-dependent oxidoreductase [Paenibacillus]MBY9078605.1 SDR family NAD(P)-dependent oxidoreductase [Paenibacillus sp. CGMCC 1.18879]MBY9084141.1 SDR family NAD(P)-dependent oxidoreductase [Paenibacillus sinensis]
MNTQAKYTALITGANSGIGLVLTRMLLERGWDVIALIRSSFQRDDSRVREFQQQGRLRVYQGDLSDFTSLRQALDVIKRSEVRIDVLFNNAGGSFPELLFSKQGRELHFETQAVAPYVIYSELRELLLAGDLKTVIGTSSAAINYVKRLNPEKLEHPDTFKKLLGPYADSKLAHSLWIKEAAPSAFAQGIRLQSVDPGPNNTMRPGNRSGLPIYVKPLMKLFFPGPEHGASLLYEAAVSGSQYPPGSYLHKGKPAKLPFESLSPAVLKLVKSVYEREFAGVEAK